MWATGARLGQLRPAVTTDVTLYTAVLATEIMMVSVCNNTASPANMRLYHVKSGETAGIPFAIYYDKAVPANDTLFLKGEAQGGGIQMEIGDSLVVATGTADALTFLAWGVTQDLASERIRGF